MQRVQKAEKQGKNATKCKNWSKQQHRSLPEQKGKIKRRKAKEDKTKKRSKTTDIHENSENGTNIKATIKEQIKNTVQNITRWKV